MAMTLGYWDIRRVSEGSSRAGGMEAGGQGNAAQLGTGGGTEEEKIRVDSLGNEIMDTRMHLEKLKPEYLEDLTETMKLFSQFLGSGLGLQGTRVWCSSPAFLQLTYVAFFSYDMVDYLLMFEPKCLDAFPNLKDFMACFEVIPLILLLFMSLLSFLFSPMLSHFCS
ncbi:hypothetical protein HPG69_000996 [Diceros bicornis minor]|uniref:glutathione transferase n=1 Tax=Diceros bicornis minor TaxID=77932 RepID=A0A7J7E5Q7_DICBM|nr:hypothetical protein HPG69_000996 [Diceros bicornis minor]